MDASGTRLLLLRHATAGERGAWSGDDGARPLDRRGRAQARVLVDRLASRGVRRIVSSPALRCVQTVEPLAEALGLEVELADELAEGSTAGEVAELAARVGGGAVLCTHGDVVEAVVGEGRPAEKGSTWLLELRAGALVPTLYLAIGRDSAPPSAASRAAGPGA